MGHSSWSGESTKWACFSLRLAEGDLSHYSLCRLMIDERDSFTIHCKRFPLVETRVKQIIISQVKNQYENVFPQINILILIPKL